MQMESMFETKFNEAYQKRRSNPKFKMRVSHGGQCFEYASHPSIPPKSNGPFTDDGISE